MFISLLKKTIPVVEKMGNSGRMQALFFLVLLSVPVAFSANPGSETYDLNGCTVTPSSSASSSNYTALDIGVGEPALSGMSGSIYSGDAGFARRIGNFAPDVNLVDPNGGEQVYGTGYGIDFNVQDRDASRLYATIAYSSSPGAFDNDINSGIIINRYNKISALDCSGKNWSLRRTCTYYWNTHTVPDGNYYVDINVWDVAKKAWDSDSSDAHFTLDNNAPSTTWDANGEWQAGDVNVHLACADGNGSGCYSTMYRLDDDNSDSVNYGSWQSYNPAAGIVVTSSGDGNYAIDFNSTDNFGHVETTNTHYILIDKLAPVITINRPEHGNLNVVSVNVDFNVDRRRGSPINIDSITVDINGTDSSVFNASTHCNSYGNGSYHCSYNETAFIGGNDYNLFITAQDGMGREATATSIFHKLVGIFGEVNSPDGGECWSEQHAIDFDVYNTSNLDMHVRVSYSQIAGQFSIDINEDLYLDNYAVIEGLYCEDTNWEDSTNCTYSWDTSGVSEGLYFIDINVWNASYETDADSSDAYFTIDRTSPTGSVAGVSSETVYEDTVFLACTDNLSGCVSEKKYYFSATQSCSETEGDYTNSTTGSTLLIAASHTDYLCVWFEDNAGNSDSVVSEQLHVDPPVYVISQRPSESQIVATADLNDVCGFRFVDANITVDCPYETTIRIRERGEDYNRAFVLRPDVYVSSPKDIKVVLETDINSFSDPNYYIKFTSASRTVTSQGDEEDYSVVVVEERLIPMLRPNGTLEIGTLLVKIPRKAQ